MSDAVERWLETFMCKQYADIFKVYGFKTLQSVCQLQPGDLLQMGIGQDHCNAILENVYVLRQTILAGNSEPNPTPNYQAGVVTPASSALRSVAMNANLHRAPITRYRGEHPSQYSQPSNHSNRMPHPGMAYPPGDMSHMAAGAGSMHNYHMMQQGYTEPTNQNSMMMSQGYPPMNSNMYGPHGGASHQIPAQQYMNHQCSGAYTGKMYQHGGNMNNMAAASPAGMGGAGTGRQMYSDGASMSGGSPRRPPPHPHLRQSGQVPNPQMVADNILNMTASNYHPSSIQVPIEKTRPNPQQPYNTTPPRMPHPQLYPMQQPNSPTSIQSTGHMWPQQNPRFTYPNTSPHPSSLRSSPISPMPQHSPASQHSNQSMHNSSPGPPPMHSPGSLQSAGGGSIPQSSVRSPMSAPSPGSALNCSPSTQQPMVSPLQQMRSPPGQAFPNSMSPAGQMVNNMSPAHYANNMSPAPPHMVNNNSVSPAHPMYTMANSMSPVHPGINMTSNISPVNPHGNHMKNPPLNNMSPSQHLNNQNMVSPGYPNQYDIDHGQYANQQPPDMDPGSCMNQVPADLQQQNMNNQYAQQQMYQMQMQQQQQQQQFPCDVSPNPGGYQSNPSPSSFSQGHDSASSVQSPLANPPSNSSSVNTRLSSGDIPVVHTDLKHGVPAHMNPLVSLQKLVMLSETNVVNPKSVIHEPKMAESSPRRPGSHDDSRTTRSSSITQGTPTPPPPPPRHSKKSEVIKLPQNCKKAPSLPKPEMDHSHTKSSDERTETKLHACEVSDDTRVRNTDSRYSDSADHVENDTHPHDSHRKDFRNPKKDWVSEANLEHVHDNPQSGAEHHTPTDNPPSPIHDQNVTNIDCISPIQNYNNSVSDNPAQNPEVDPSARTNAHLVNSETGCLEDTHENHENQEKTPDEIKQQDNLKEGDVEQGAEIKMGMQHKEENTPNIVDSCSSTNHETTSPNPGVETTQQYSVESKSSLSENMESPASVGLIVRKDKGSVTYSKENRHGVITITPPPLPDNSEPERLIEEENGDEEDDDDEIYGHIGSDDIFMDMEDISPMSVKSKTSGMSPNERISSVSDDDQCVITSAVLRVPDDKNGTDESISDIVITTTISPDKKVTAIVSEHSTAGNLPNHGSEKGAEQRTENKSVIVNTNNNAVIADDAKDLIKVESFDSSDCEIVNEDSKLRNERLFRKDSEPHPRTKPSSESDDVVHSKRKRNRTKSGDANSEKSVKVLKLELDDCDRVEKHQIDAAEKEVKLEDVHRPCHSNLKPGHDDSKDDIKPSTSHSDGAKYSHSHKKSKKKRKSSSGERHSDSVKAEHARP